jgi:hypothetical protein
LAATPVAAFTVAAALAAAGCGKDDRPLPPACTQGAGAIAIALREAPHAVRLSDGTRLSTCVERARSDADIQNLGSLYTTVADALATRAHGSDRAALELGYLVGATRRGAAHTNGIHLELQRRLEQAIGVGGPPAPRRAAYGRGLVAGARAG